MTATPVTYSRFSYQDGTLSVNGATYTCVNLRMVFHANKLPLIRAVITPEISGGSDTDGPASYSALIDAMLPVQRGSAATVTYSLAWAEDATETPETAETFTVFSGIVSGWAPVWIANRMSITVWLAHPLSLLDWDSPVSDAIHGRGWADYDQPILTEYVGDLTAVSPGKYTAANAQSDLWKLVLKPMLVERLGDSVFGSSISDAAVAYLNDDTYDLSESTLPLAVGDAKSAIAYCRSVLYRGDLSPWSALCMLGEKLHFRVLPRPNGYSVAPVLPGMGGSAPEYLLTKDAFTIRQDTDARRALSRDSGLLLQGPSNYTGFFDSVTTKLVTASDMRSPAGGVTVHQSPVWLSGVYGQTEYTAQTMGLRDSLLYVSGCRVDTEDGTAEQTRNVRRNETLQAGLTAELQAAQGYRRFAERTTILRGGITFDPSPGSVVRIEMQGYDRPADGGDPEEYMVGHVHSVLVDLSINTRQAGTWVLLTHLRTREEQEELEPSRHPMYDKRWVSAPLLTLSGLSSEQEVS